MQSDIPAPRSMWDTTPRGRRTIADLTTLIGSGSRSRVALMVGAGFDTAIRQRPGWSGLIRELALKCRIGEDATRSLEAVAYKRPIEAAAALRATVGSIAFWQALRGFVSTASPISQTMLDHALTAAVSHGVRLILNFNYTSDLLDVLDRAEHGKTVLVIDQFTLGSWSLQDLLFPSDDYVHVIYIHGLIDPQSVGEPGMVLDRKGYDEAISGTPHYAAILNRLFEDFTVITLGMSWNDFPLQNAAAHAQFSLKAAAKIHCAILPHSTDRCDDYWLERGMVGSYGVRPLLYSTINDTGSSDHHEAACILREVTNHVPVRPLEVHLADIDLIQIADYLDRWGDYESGTQSDWMALNWEHIKRTIECRCRERLTKDIWLALAQIERHLRHFLWFYLSPIREENEKESPRVRERKSVWKLLARLWDTLDRKDKDELWDTQAFSRPVSRSSATPSHNRAKAIFEFAIGAYEVDLEIAVQEVSQEMGTWRHMLEGIQANAPVSLFAKRVSLAQKGLWRKPILRRLSRMRQAAAEAGWEGIEAKIALDQAEITFEKLYKKEGKRRVPRDWDEISRHTITTLADDARDLSRIAGCIRREVGAVVLGSFAAPASEAEGSLVAIQRRFAESGGRRRELSMMWWIAIGLLAVYCDRHRNGGDDVGEATRYLKRLCGVPELGSDSQYGAITQNSIPHWRKYHVKAANLAEKVAEVSWHPSSV